MNTYIVLLGASGDLSQGTRWYKVEAKKPEDAAEQLVSDLGREADFTAADVVEVTEVTHVAQQTAWTPVHKSGGA